MSILFPVRPQPAGERAFIAPTLPSYWGQPSTTAGQRVTPETASHSAAVTACRRVIVASIVGMGVEAFQRKDGRWMKSSNVPAIVRAPSARMRQRDWIAQMVNSMVLKGVAYGYVTSFDAQGRPATVEPLHWSAVRWGTDRGTGSDAPFVNDHQESVYPVGRLLVINASPYLMPGAPVAQSPVELAKEAIGTGFAAEQFAATFFRDGGFPTSVVYSDQELTQSDAQGLKDRLMNAVRGSREPAVLGSGLKWETMSVDQPTWVIDLLRFEIEQCARFFGIPPTMIYGSISGQAVTYSNLTQSESSFFKLSLKSWLDDLESGWSALLPEPQQVRLNVDDFLRMDAETRHKDQQVRLQSKSATLNEIRAEEDKDPFVELDDQGVNVYDQPGVPGGDPSNMTEPSQGADNGPPV